MTVCGAPIVGVGSPQWNGMEVMKSDLIINSLRFLLVSFYYFETIAGFNKEEENGKRRWREIVFMIDGRPQRVFHICLGHKIESYNTCIGMCSLRN